MAAMSKILRSGFVGVSSQIIFVEGLRAARTAERSVMSVKLAVRPRGPMTLSKRRNVPP
jgi:hypothetical protein